MGKLSNISLKKYLKALEICGLKCIRSSGGHYVYSRKDLLRPIVVQTHINPVPESIISSNLRTMNMSKLAFVKVIEST